MWLVVQSIIKYVELQSNPKTKILSYSFKFQYISNQFTKIFVVISETKMPIQLSIARENVKLIHKCCPHPLRMHGQVVTTKSETFYRDSKVKGKLLYCQESPEENRTGQLSTTCSNATEVAQMGNSSGSRPQPAMVNGVRDGRSN